MKNPILALALLLMTTGCEAVGDIDALAETGAAAQSAGSALPAPVCQVAEASLTLPAEVRETSGLARSARDPGLLWTHNDAGNSAEIFALEAAGGIVQRTRISGAESADWEDIDLGPCDGGECLYIGDIGDNDAEREHVTIYRVEEPEVGASESTPAVALHARFPDGAQDAEGLFILPSGEPYIVTKGRRGPIGLYRYPLPQRPAETVTLERVRELFPEPDDNDDRVSAATVSPDGAWIGIRSYRNLYLYPADALIGGGPLEPTVVDLAPLAQAQGEAVAIAADGSVWLSTEAESGDTAPEWGRLQCTFPTG